MKLGSSIVLSRLVDLAEDDDDESLSFGDLVRLARVDRTMFEMLLGMPDGLLYDAIGTHRLSCRLVRVVSGSSTGAFPLQRVPTYRMLCSNGWVPRQSVRLNDRVYEIRRAPASTVRYMMRSKLCRECMRPTRAEAVASTRRVVRICVACSKNVRGYSALCARDEIHAHNMRREWHLRRRVLDEHIQSLVRARIGGNRAHLFWRCQALQF